LKIYYATDVGDFSIILLEIGGKPYAMQFWPKDAPRPEGFIDELTQLEGRDPETAFLSYMKFGIFSWEYWKDDELAHPDLTYERIHEILNNNLDIIEK
jgi:hypothetical protein